MKVSDLIEHLRTAQRQYGDVGVCFAQLQANGKTVRMTRVSANTFGAHGVLFLTNMSQTEVEKHLDI